MIRIAILTSRAPTAQASGTSWLCRTLQEYFLSNKAEARVLYATGKTRREHECPRTHVFKSYLRRSISPSLFRHILTEQYDIYIILGFEDLTIELSALMLRFKSKTIFLIPQWHHDFAFRSRIRRMLFRLRRNLFDYPIMCLVRPDIVSISDYERRILNRFSKHIIQIPLGIDLNEEHWPDCWWNASRKREGGGEINVITTGRLEPNKVPLYILRSLDIVRRTGRRVKLHMLTARVDDLFLRKFISEVNRLGLQDVVRIIDASKMDRSTVFSMVAQADIALFPSYSESFGIAVLEYLYCGVPVVATRTGVAQYLESRGCLLAVDWGDVESMAEMILYASDMNKVERDRITRTARNLVEEEFNQQRFLQSFWNQIDRRYRQKCG